MEHSVITMPLALTENAKIVLQKRYLLRNPQGEIAETPEELFQRVSKTIAAGDLKFGKTSKEVEALAQDFYQLMTSLEFMPNSPTLMNAGKPEGQLSACFVLPVPDSLQGIFETLKDAALIHQSGGGTGFSFSRLRPKGDFLSYTSGVTSGPLSFMDVYNAATEAIKQGGTRRGANMGILRVDHPDIEAFIHAKNDLNRLTNFNISVAVTNAFMQAVEADQPFDLIHPKTKAIAKTVSARHLMQQIVDSAWRTGEPGVVFIDKINAENVTPGIGEIEATNPCGEVPLLPYEACNLGSINLSKMLKQSSTGSFEIDWEHFQRTISKGIHFLENVIVQNTFPLPQIQTMVEGNRKIGMGLMGWADSLLLMKIPYDSEEALALAENVMAFMSYHSKLKSVALAKERGSFAYFDKSVYVNGKCFRQKYATQSQQIISAAEWEALDKEIQTHGLRHATTLCLAPTGTISIIAGASGGIEPLYALVFMRNVMENTKLLEVNPIFKEALVEKGLYSEERMKNMLATGSIQGLAEMPETLQNIFKTARDISPSWHVRMQAVFQKYCDNAVSKTINFPETATPDDIAETYQAAYHLGLKGITVYRDNSRKQQPMSLEKSSEIIDGQRCPECKKTLQLIEGCFQCPDCQYAYCG